MCIISKQNRITSISSQKRIAGIKSLLLLLVATVSFSACSNADREQPDTEQASKVSANTNILTKQEKEEGWVLLFDGENTEKWRGANAATFPEEGWTTEDGLLTVHASDGSQEGWGGDIVTKETYSDFELSLEFRLTEGANSGIKYYVLEDEYAPGAALGLEYQLLDDQRHPDAKQGRDGNRTVSSLYDLIPAADDKPINPPGQWNHARIIANDGKVEHWLNGEKVLEYERGSEEFRDLIARSKYSDYDRFGEAEEGHILLQDHGDEVSFRNIKIRELTEEGLRQ